MQVSTDISSIKTSMSKSDSVCNHEESESVDKDGKCTHCKKCLHTETIIDTTDSSVVCIGCSTVIEDRPLKDTFKRRSYPDRIGSTDFLDIIEKLNLPGSIHFDFYKEYYRIDDELR